MDFAVIAVFTFGGGLIVGAFLKDLWSDESVQDAWAEGYSEGWEQGYSDGETDSYLKGGENL